MLAYVLKVSLKNKYPFLIYVFISLIPPKSSLHAFKDNYQRHGF
jgi:hypothetical protein